MSRTKKVLIELSRDEREALERLVRRQSIARRDAQRAEIVLRAAGGANNCEIAAALGVTRKTVRAWRTRFVEQRLDGLSDEPRCGAAHRIDDDRIAAIIAKMLEDTPINATQRNIREIAKAVGVSTSSVYRIWRAFSPQPHPAKTFNLSSDPQFIENVRDIVGLYLDPPDKALAICVDERGQIQALDHKQPMLPIRPGQIARHTRDYERQETTTLFAGFKASVIVQAMDRPDEVRDICGSRDQSSEFRDFLEDVERNVPTDFDIYVVMDNIISQKTKLIANEFAKRSRWNMHFTPTSSPWLKHVERFFDLLYEKQIKRGDHRSMKDLIEVIEIFIDNHNTNPKPLRWVKSANAILGSVGRFHRHPRDARPKGG